MRRRRQYDLDMELSTPKLGADTQRKLLTVTAPHYEASAIWERGRQHWKCVDAPPLLHWMRHSGPATTKRILSKQGGADWSWSDAARQTSHQQFNADHPATHLAERVIIALRRSIPAIEHGAGRPYAGIGARATPPDVAAAMQLVAAQLADFGWVLRSGGADGADTAFAIGAGYCGGSIDEHRYEIFLPWPGFNRQSSPHDAPSQRAIEIAERHHPAWTSLTRGVRSLQARNSHQILGADLSSPAEFVLAWTPDGADNVVAETGSKTGGTGQAIRVAGGAGVPVINLRNLEIEQAPRQSAGAGVGVNA